VVETQSDLDEAKAAVSACSENTSCEVVCTMTFEASGDNQFNTMMGVTPQQMIEEIVPLGASIVGTNCGNGIQNMVKIAEQIRSIDTSVPILVGAYTCPCQRRCTGIQGRTNHFPGNPGRDGCLGG
jgi:5-methyltetrahydrofolate--homocysteine methyltransferase